MALATTSAIGLLLRPGITGEATAAAVTPLAPIPATDPLRTTVATWYRLQQTDSLPFLDYATFLEQHPGWPGEAAMRRAAERQIQRDVTPPSAIVAFFAKLPPQTSTGRLRYAEALQSTGQAPQARAAAIAAWTGGALPPDEEQRLLQRFPGAFGQSDQDSRMEKLLWDGSTAAAQRQIALVSPARQPIYQARLAMQTRAADAADKAALVGPGGTRDPGFVIDRANWLRDSSQSAVSRLWLGEARQLDAPALVPQKYLQTLLTAANGAGADGQASTAWSIARAADAAFPAGTDIRQRSFGERDVYTSLVWLGGVQALQKLNRPADAIPLFLAYARGSQTPQSQTKGYYWAGRSAERLGDRATAQTYYGQAAANIDQYYGQLATERLGRILALPADPPALVVSPAQRQAFFESEVVRAARLLGQDGRWADQTMFVRTIAANAKTDADHVLAGELAQAIARPDLGVMVSRNARNSGTRDPIRIGFPTIAVPPTMADHWTIVHAITRQESQFDRQATSRTGAKGMMQLMPATAAEQAGKLGLAHDPSRLTEPSYNVMLGSAFFDRMLNYYNGSYVLAVASYNAGPGNVNKFIRANGDPRMPGVDVVDWIEAIPFTETRGYVQRVLENAVVYDLMNPQRARTPSTDRLSHYLGKKTPG
ncbi:transglycosylase SLT domain-containing protein [Sphingomonas naphthae]|uniref:Transglycosylase SLT domain-containing protein n=1 Tax=Sphingomonas naphthae TaxID=1813468 RepID=A0ABY7TNR2_9SPHN|nr:lytic transglycosylase domain-containing protein [Sphingomonas naphthae]WCT74882.1 transglycosylase SLT domain-containing protein [Sphingomonas naphthae]